MAAIYGYEFDLFRRVRGGHEHAAPCAMLRQDTIILTKSLAAGSDVKLSCDFDDHVRIRGSRSLRPFRITPQEASDESCVGDARFALILAQTQETAASRTMCVEIHRREVLRTRSRSV